MIKIAGDEEDVTYYPDSFILNAYKKDSNAKGNFVFRPHAFELFLTIGSALLIIFLINKGIGSDWSVVGFIFALIVPVFLFGYGISQVIYLFLLSKYMHGLYKKEALRRNLI